MKKSQILCVVNLFKFMYHKKLIQGELLTLIVEKDIFDIQEIEDTSKLNIDCKGMLELYENFKQKAEMEAAAEEKKIGLSKQDKVEITMGITKALLSDLSSCVTALPKNRRSLFNKISHFIRNYQNSRYKNASNWKKHAKSWVFNLLQQKNIIISDDKKIEINKDQMYEYLNSINSKIKICKQEASQMNFLQ